jgi:hypothetical protein
MSGRGLVTLAALVLAGSAALAQSPAPFSCTIDGDGQSVRVKVSNPHPHEAQCTVNCSFNTTKTGTRFGVECGRGVGAGAKDFELCVKTFNGGRIVKLLEGKASCLNTEVKEEQDDDEDSDALIQKLQKQSQDFIDGVKKKP